MSGKTGKRVTARKPVSTRRHYSLADGAFGRENPDQMRLGDERNTKSSGEPSKQHSKYKHEREKKMAKKPRKGISNAKTNAQGPGKKGGQTKGQFEHDPKGRIGQYTAAGNAALTKK